MLVDVANDGSGTQTQWVAEAGVLDLFFLLGPDPATVSLIPCDHDSMPNACVSWYASRASILLLADV